MPYPLPDDPEQDALRWFLVAVPDRPEYVKAALGTYTEPGAVFQWGLEGVEAGSPAARQSWNQAVIATLEALEMGFPDILLSYIDEVEALLRSIRDSQCCQPWDISGDMPGGGEVVPYDDDVPPPTSDYTQSTGPFPPDYETDPTGETPFADSAAFQEYLCKAVHWYFDWLLTLLRYTETMVRFNYGPAFVVSWLVDHFARRIIGPVGDVIALFTGEDFHAWLNNLLQGMLADDIAAQRAILTEARDDIVCAILEAETATEAASILADEISARLTYAIVETLLLSGPLAAIGAAIWNGIMSTAGYEEAVCCPEPLPVWGFDTDAEGWMRASADGDPPTISGTPAPWSGTEGQPVGSLVNSTGLSNYNRISPPFAWPGGVMRVALQIRTSDRIVVVRLYTADLSGAAVASFNATSPPGTNWRSFDESMGSIGAGSYRLVWTSPGVWVDNVTPYSP